MRVAFISRSTIYSAPGGDTTQLDMTAANLRELGVEVDIYPTDRHIDHAKYDLLHFFNIIRPADILRHILVTDTPFVISTIYVQYGEYEKKARKGLARVAGQLFSEDRLEYLKVIARRILNGEKIGSAKYILWGHRRSVQYVANNASMLLPNSHSEFKRFAEAYKVDRPYQVVPNGVNEKYVTRRFPFNDRYKDAVICMARVEGIKNQLNLVRALNDTKFQLYIHGKASPNHKAYYDQCKAEAGSNVHISGFLQGEELYAAYQSAKVHILPSYFETTGLSSLEAAVMGCNIVVTRKGDTEEYFKDFAWYCDPDDIGSIRKAVDAAYAAPYNEAFRTYILEHYTWKKAAGETLKAYKKVLNK